MIYYEYEPLETSKHIRLLRLSNPESSDRLQYDLYQESLESPKSTFPDYAALSYTWGNPEFSRSITVNGRRLDVTENLYAALQTLDLGEQSLWIDAICINQKDDVEKNTQIPLMTMIYACAIAGVIWLGEESEDSKLALQFILDLHNLFTTSGEVMDDFIFAFGGGSAPTYSKTKGLLQELADAGRLAYGSAECVAVGNLLNRPWFKVSVRIYDLCYKLFTNSLKRAWIIQEVSKSFNQILCCGKDRLPWYLFSEFCDYVTKFGLTNLFARPNQTVLSVGLVHVSIMRKLNTELGSIGTQTWIHNGQVGKGEESSLVNLLRITKNFQATDPRDRLYALLGLAQDGDHPRLAADYRLSAEEVYIRSATYFLEEQCAIWILYRAHGIDNDSLLPSWVPDWRKDARSWFHFWRFDYKHPYCADGSIEPNICIDQTSRKLTISGIHFDTVKETSAPCAPTSITLEQMSPAMATLLAALNFLKEARDMAINTLRPTDWESTSDPWLDNVWDSVWRTLCGNVRKHRYPAPDYWVHAIKFYWERHLLEATELTGNQAKFEEYRKSLLETQERITAALPDGTDWQTEYGAYMSQFEQATTNQRFCMTEKRRPGLASPDARPGDMLVVLFGGHVPFILRPCEGSDSEYINVGEAYVHGCMQGEILSDGHYEAKDFTIV